MSGAVVQCGTRELGTCEVKDDRTTIDQFSSVHRLTIAEFDDQSSDVSFIPMDSEGGQKGIAVFKAVSISFRVTDGLVALVDTQVNFRVYN